MHDDQSHALVEALARLGHTYRHFQKEHEREPAESPTRRALEVKMRQAAERFEQLLGHWVSDGALRKAWIRNLHESGPRPDGPLIAAPRAFKGITETGSRVEILTTDERGYDLIVDGRVETHETVPWVLGPDVSEPIRIHAHECREVFDAPPEALQMLAAFLATRDSAPPRPWARALFEDGLIDANFGLTPRGARKLKKAGPQPAMSPAPITFGILAVDAARARLFILSKTRGLARATVDRLVEVLHTVRPDERARDSDLFADTRPGLQREGPHGPRHGVSDHRGSERRAAGKRFAAQLVDEAVRVWRAHRVTRAVLVASPAMLGALRSAFLRLPQARSGAAPWTLSELARDLTRLSSSELHDVLASAGFLPRRGRLPSLRPAPGQPI